MATEAFSYEGHVTIAMPGSSRAGGEGRIFSSRLHQIRPLHLAGVVDSDSESSGSEVDEVPGSLSAVVKGVQWRLLQPPFRSIIETLSRRLFSARPTGFGPCAVKCLVTVMLQEAMPASASVSRA